MKKITVFTGTRAEYGILTPVMEEIRSHPNLQLYLIATGMHTSKKFGYTLEKIKQDFENISWFNINPDEDDPKKLLESMTSCSLKTFDILEKTKPDIFLCLGDRSETYSAATACLVSGIPIAHIHGGDKTKAGLDESFRHAITKISNIHFAATKKSAERIKKLGEKKEYIFHVGSPSLDTILKKELIPEEEIRKKYGLIKDHFALVVQHPVSSQPHLSGQQMSITLNSIEESNLEAIVIYPNNDLGHEKIIEEIKKREGPNLKAYKNIPHLEYLSLLKYANLLIGNSSSGIIDSSAFYTPTINVGIRQNGRERGKNVLDVPHKKDEIINAIEKCLYAESSRTRFPSPYGDGNSSKRITDILSKIKINEKLMQKQITY